MTANLNNSTLQCHVLVVDDSPILRAAIKKVVKLAGVPEDRIFEAGNGVEALEVLETVWIELGVKHTLRKPFEPEALCRLISDVLGLKPSYQ